MTTEAPPAPQHDLSARPSGGRWLELAVIFIVFFIEGGAAPPHVNETHYLCKAKHYWDPSFCPGDFFLNSADAHLAFYWTVGWLTKWLSLPAVAWVGRIAAWALMAVGWQRVVRTVTDLPWAAALSAALWVGLIYKFNFAGEWAVGGVEGKCFAYGFVLLGLAAMARGQWRTPWLWFGAAAAMHVLVGGWAAAAALGVFLSEPRDRRPPLRSLCLPCLMGLALSLPGLLPALALERGVDAATAAEAAQIYVFERLPHHLAPLSLPPDEVRRRCAALGALGFALLILWQWTARQTARPQAGGCPAAPLERIMRLAALALLANVGGLFIEWALADRPAEAAQLLRYYWFRQADVVLPLAVAVGAVAVLSASLRPVRWTTLAVAMGAVAAGWHLIDVTATRWRQPWPPATAKVDDLASWRQACQWVRDQAPPDAVCLVPRDAQSFKWYAERADVVNWKDVPQDAAGVVEWRRRLRDVFPVVKTADGQRILGSPEQWPARHVREAANRYGARYVIARSSPPLPLPRVFPAQPDPETDWYVVYDLAPPNGEEAP